MSNFIFLLQYWIKFHFGQKLHPSMVFLVRNNYGTFFFSKKWFFYKARSLFREKVENKHMATRSTVYYVAVQTVTHIYSICFHQWHEHLSALQNTHSQLKRYWEFYKFIICIWKYKKWQMSTLIPFSFYIYREVWHQTELFAIGPAPAWGEPAYIYIELWKF